MHSVVKLQMPNGIENQEWLQPVDGRCHSGSSLGLGLKLLPEAVARENNCHHVHARTWSRGVRQAVKSADLQRALTTKSSGTRRSQHTPRINLQRTRVYSGL
jgi:hypothetical protein